MLTKDYIMRMIDTLVKVIERVLHLKEIEDFNGALDEIDKVTKELFGFDRNFINNLSDAQLVKMVSASEVLIAPNCYLLGALFKEEAEIFRLQNQEDTSIELYERALNLFVEGLRNSSAEIEEGHLNKIKGVVDILENESVTIDTEESLFFYYEFTGAYDKAENLIYDLIEYDNKYIENGISFCERLLKKDDNELINGNLPREEIAESLLSLRNKRNS